MKSVKSLRPVNRPCAYELAAEQIKQMIRAGTWSVGERIPAERELAEQLAISRGTTREALRALEAMGWIAVRPGEGAIVRDPTGVPFVSSVFSEPTNQLARLGELWEARKLIEPHAAYLAAERRSEDALAAIEARRFTA